MVCLEDKNKFILNEDGQSAVEYILLLVVVVSLTLSVFKNPKFKEFFGEDSYFFTAMKMRMQYSYQHGLVGETDTTTSTYTGNHDTYFNSATGKTRFIAPVSKYPGP
jgi:Flp pilus assembly pilin Flp